ncbi:class I SAM-dependent methyltransferase [Schaedlerella arabinosiphila]|jgi:hypothetical protein|uniref:Class I SAM-dependent methyltransferase n=2 Tax=Schaedlerella arabinosiphila TaxID=2044587 RepID=A0A426DPG4_9FIRM|nr:class I SAM-dependent methyltransferase [Schaedlerella arabinosiphila]
MKIHEAFKRSIKSRIPWRLRYFMKLQEAKGNLKLTEGIKQFREMEEYNSELYEALENLKITEFKEKTICELGPGQHLSHAFLEYQMGAEKEILLEIADFAQVDSPAVLTDLKLEREYMAQRLLPQISTDETWKSYLKKINAVYSIDGMKGYKKVPDNSVDYCFSFAVLEHIRKNIFSETIQEIYRFMREGGTSYHTVDFTDHMGGRKNQLRFPESVWEDDIHYRMDNYTNRISCSAMCKMIRDVGFNDVKVKHTRVFKKLPIKREDISSDIGYISDDDLKIAMAIIVMKK